MGVGRSMRWPFRPVSSFRLGLLPWVALSLGLGITALWCADQRNFQRLEHERIERDLSQEISQAISERLQTNIVTLDSVVGLFNASEQVSLAEFTTFYDTLNGRGSTLKGIQGLGYAAVVPDNNVAAFEQQIRREGQPDFTIKPPRPRELTTAIVYLQPNDWRNQRAVGYDMYSQPTRRAAMQQAALTGEPVLSGPVRLLQETNLQPQVGALLYQAVYRQPEAIFPSSEDRLRRLRGWAYSPLRIDDLIEGALATVQAPALENAAVVIYDSDRQIKRNLVFDNRNLTGSDRLTHPTWRNLTVANRNWEIGVQLDHRSIDPDGWSQGLLLQALLGLSLSALAAVISQRLLASHLELREALARVQDAAKERALAATVFDSSPIGIVVTDSNGVIVRINPAYSQLSGYSDLEARGRKANLMRSGRHEASFYEQMWTAIIQRCYWSGEIWNRHRNGQIMRHELTITAVLDSRHQITNFVGLLNDVSDRYRQQEQMQYLATHDPLTGLANRALLAEELERSLALARRENRGVGLLFMDLNEFKPVNDRYGHAAGDLLLQALALRLKDCLRDSDTLCRQGGDEFVVLVPNAPSLESLLVLARKLHHAIEQPFEAIMGLSEPVRISVSIGVARWPDHAGDADSLIRAADAAMYRAKSMQEPRILVAD